MNSKSWLRLLLGGLIAAWMAAPGCVRIGFEQPIEGKADVAAISDEGGSGKEVSEDAAGPEDVPDKPKDVPDKPKDVKPAEDAIVAPDAVVEKDVEAPDGGCLSASECEAPDDPCKQAVCVDFECKVELAPDGTLCGVDDPCTILAVCVEGSCLSVPKDCDDGEVCTEDSCVDGDCKNEPVQCDDYNPCTENKCKPGYGCKYPPINCADEVECTIDYCDPQQGGCVNAPVQCDCTTDEGCSGLGELAGACASYACVDGGCVQVSVEDGTSCDDGDPCTLEDSCTNGQCAGVGKVCESPEPCVTAACQEGQCVYADMNCDDGDACTVDVCDSGECFNQELVCDDDGIACTVATCVVGSDGEATCQQIPEGCDCLVDSDCVDMLPPDPSPGGAYECYQATCVDYACTLGLVPDGTLCSDGDGCTLTDVCIAGYCAGLNPKDCDDNKPCTQDGCYQGGCYHETESCDDNNPCTEDSCGANGAGGAGGCLHTPIVCDDGNPCTIDYCDPLAPEGMACQHVQDYFCTWECTSEGDCPTDPCYSPSCVAGMCSYSQPICIADGPCEMAHCSPTGECSWDYKPSGSPCMIDASVQGACNSEGVCVPFG